MHEIGGKLEAIQRVYRLTLTPELSGILSSNQNTKKKTIGSTGNTVYNRKENTKIKIAEMNRKLNDKDKKNRDKLRKEDALLSNSDGAKVRVTLEEMHGGGDYHFGTDRDDEDKKEISNFQNFLLTSTSTSSSTSTPLNTFSKTSKSGLKNDLRELHGDVLKQSTSLLTENKERNENENENDSRGFLWDSKEALLRDDRDNNNEKDVMKVKVEVVEGVRGEVRNRNGAPIGVSGDTLGYTPTVTTGGIAPGVRVREGRTGRGLGRIEAQNIVQTHIDNDVQKQKQGQGQGQDKAPSKGNLISYIRMTAFDRIGSKVLVNILDDQVRTIEVLHCTYTLPSNPLVEESDKYGGNCTITCMTCPARVLYKCVRTSTKEFSIQIIQLKYLYTTIF